MNSTVRRIVRNFFSLNIVQIASYVFPLIALPYIVRVIGPEKYGAINFAQAIIVYFTLVVLYSFDYTATREISAHRDDHAFVSRLFYTVIATRLLIFIILAVPLFLLLQIPKFHQQHWLYIILYFMNLGIALYPQFFFQGIEELQRVAVFNFIIKFVFTVSVFVLLRTEDDYLFVPVSTTLGYCVVGIISFIYAIRRYSLSFVRIPFREIRSLIKNSFKIFISSITTNLYTTTNTVLIGFFVGDTAVGYFSAAEKLVSVIQNVTLNPMFQTLFPFLGKTLYDNRPKGIEYLEKVFLWIFVISFLLSVGVVLFAPLLVRILFGQKFAPTVPVLYFLAWLLFLRGISGICGIQGMVNLKMDREFLHITIVGMVLCFIFNLILLSHFAEVGSAAAWILTEIYISISTFHQLKKNGIFSFTRSKIKSILTKLPYV